MINAHCRTWNMARKLKTTGNEKLGAGVMLKKDKPEYIKSAVIKVINSNEYKENSKNISKSFHNAGRAKRSADVILKIIDESK